MEVLETLSHERPEITIIYVTHFIEEIIPIFDKIFILSKGVNFAQGNIDDVLTSKTMSSLFNRNVEVMNYKNRFSLHDRVISLHNSSNNATILRKTRKGEGYMTLNNIKAIFLDMDGTILHEDNKASIKTKSVIDELREKGYKIFLATGRSYTEIDQLVPPQFEVDGIISSNGTSGEVNDDNLFMHSLSSESVKRIVSLAQRQEIYYEVFPFNGSRIALNEDKAWMQEMIKGDTPPNHVSESEWKSRLDAMSGKIDWKEDIPEDDYAKIYLFTPNLEK